MNHREALAEVIEKFAIKASDIAQSAHIEEAQFSRFKTGKSGLNLATWEHIVEALPHKARAYLYFLLATNDETKPAA
ncbi:hypothetical protein [Pseudanabaena yagii]|uniref:DNA-binding protein n=1 Tax=Pseudanabaena yagii GIHE-NHR1 TaxID=2722753 RepID=A0ABX1LYX7_9CYAN|nr:hypothetical protein [Pseudanabaena yagii]NMF60161.1 hypothetical protein [Pseudanabaena yagii GIHE-NHR1]